MSQVVIYSLRAVEALQPGQRSSTGLLSYLQVSFAMAFIGIGQDMVPLFRCLLVNATKENIDIGHEDLPDHR